MDLSPDAENILDKEILKWNSFELSGEENWVCQDSKETALLFSTSSCYKIYTLLHAYNPGENSEKMWCRVNETLMVLMAW